MPIKEIAAPTGVDHDKLGSCRDLKLSLGLVLIKFSWTARVLRLLATNHIFREVAVNVFANNKLSTMLDTWHSVDDLLKK